MSLKPATAHDALDVLRAIDHLREARRLLKRCGATKATNKVRRALKSAEGAERHIQHRRYRT
ncbi:hypothetical protein [Mesorhizobium sp.]|uniref:hypothetical protein n=1 Tax=Mesorhizobium sp. TaxID=1871066 RepID=UPI000FE7F2C6|nr:hypothetical protein [Mesorhizobium sp.]RWH50256.1 MAG: hypothetical protein EOQ80_04605 [Mesorhizobium sp.]RWH52278.1 MAG: hypothetical protein EOQ82_26640 [Mesorhizobium sp.]RWI69689.1 MAG: hypothetical protein EOR18_20895 [Mesorhizobium sp.]RWI76156.1 MAG: hypothetical protein EOR19_18485 [Mesorhizobium sp.]RWJ33226.1 MAG: hypothetical protein EOR28_11615 [Mesorhizobium sp.]